MFNRTTAELLRNWYECTPAQSSKTIKRHSFLGGLLVVVINNTHYEGTTCSIYSAKFFKKYSFAFTKHQG